MISLLIFIAVLSVLIVVHEWGHYVAARMLGVRVDRFSIGFGKVLFSRRRGDTEFAIGAIPLGGYVKMAGDERTSCRGTREEFFSRPVWHRAIIVLMGPITNLFFAFFCFYIVFLAGFPTFAPTVGQVMKGYPSQLAGLQAGDRVVAIDETPMSIWEDLQDYIMHSSKDVLRFQIERNGQRFFVDIVPQKKVIKNIFGKEETVRLIGIQPTEEFIYVHYGPLSAVRRALQQMVVVTTTVIKALYYIVSGAMPAREALSGPIGIFGVIRDAARLGMVYLLMITAVISTNLAVFNLLPIPVLDGGHLFFFALESVRRRPLPLRVEDGLTRVGLGALVCLMVFAFYNDLARVGWLDKVSQILQRLKP